MTNGRQSGIVDHFRAGLDALKQHPVIAVPPLVAQAIVFAMMVLFVGSAVTMSGAGAEPGIMGMAAAAFLVGLVSGLLSLISIGVVIVMAREGLAAREPSLGDAVSAVTGRLVDVAVASILTMAIVWVGLLLLLVPGLVAAFFLVFTLPAVLLDDHGPLTAMRRSFDLVRWNLGVTAGLFVGVIVMVVIVALVSTVLSGVPLLGQLAQAVLAGVLGAYLTVVAVRVYQTLPRR